jgi:hypothetical protein
MTMLEVSVLDYALSNILSFLAGVFLGLGVCACHKERFMQRARSVDNLQQYNHHNRMPEPTVILASAPPK